MSFIGAIGFIMGEREIKEAFVNYMQKIPQKIFFNGHAYARALRGHILTVVASSQLILSSFNMKIEMLTWNKEF